MGKGYSLVLAAPHWDVGPMICQCLEELVAVCQQPDHSPAQLHHMSDGEDPYLVEVGETTKTI